MATSINHIGLKSIHSSRTFRDDYLREFHIPSVGQKEFPNVVNYEGKPLSVLNDILDVEPKWETKYIHPTLQDLIARLRKRDKEFVVFPTKVTRTGSELSGVKEIGIYYPSDSFFVCKVIVGWDDELTIEAHNLHGTGKNSYNIERDTKRVEYACKIIRDECPRFSLADTVTAFKNINLRDYDSVSHELGKRAALQPFNVYSEEAYGLVQALIEGDINLLDPEYIETIKEKYEHYKEVEELRASGKAIVTMVHREVSQQGVPMLYCAFNLPIRERYSSVETTQKVDEAYCYKYRMDEISDTIKSKIARIQMLEVGNYVMGVGFRVSNDTYYILGDTE